MRKKFQYIQAISELEEEEKKKEMKDDEINSNLTDFISKDDEIKDKQEFDKS